MFSTGNQIRAARALIGWHRDQLAAAAGLHPNAVAYWERKSSIPAGPEPVACRRVRAALALAGVEPISEPAPGVRLLCMADNFMPAIGAKLAEKPIAKVATSSNGGTDAQR